MIAAWLVVLHVALGSWKPCAAATTTLHQVWSSNVSSTLAQGPINTPVVDGGLLFLQGSTATQRGTVICYDAVLGTRKWVVYDGTNEAEFDERSTLAVGSSVVAFERMNLAGQSAIVVLDQRTGAVLWNTSYDDYVSAPWRPVIDDGVLYTSVGRAIDVATGAVLVASALHSTSGPPVPLAPGVVFFMATCYYAALNTSAVRSAPSSLPVLWEMRFTPTPPFGGNCPQGAPAIPDDRSTIYMTNQATPTAQVYSVDAATGAFKWNASWGSEWPDIAGASTEYVYSGAAALHAATGATAWVFANYNDYWAFACSSGLSVLAEEGGARRRVMYCGATTELAQGVFQHQICALDVVNGTLAGCVDNGSTVMAGGAGPNAYAPTVIVDAVYEVASNGAALGATLSLWRVVNAPNTTAP